MTSRRWPRCSRGGWPSTSTQRERSPHDKEYDESFASLPGADRDRRRQGPAVRRACRSSAPFRDLGVTVVSLAKRIEEVFLPGPARAAAARRTTRAELQLLQRVRDEAHRFAIEFHRGRRDKAMTRSVLDELPGVGPGAQAQHPAALRLARALPARRAARSSRRCPGLPGKVARDIYAHVNKVR